MASTSTMSSTSTSTIASTNRTNTLSQNISELKTWNSILKNIRDEEIPIINREILKVLVAVCRADINGSRESQLSVLKDLTQIRAEREVLHYLEGAVALDGAIKRRLQALKSPLHTLEAGAVNPPQKQARYASPPRRALPRRSISPPRRASSPYRASSRQWVFPPRGASPPCYASPFREASPLRRKRSLSPLTRRRSLSPAPRMTYRSALSLPSSAVTAHPPRRISCYYYSVFGTRVGLDDCDLVYWPSQGCYLLYERRGDHYEEYRDEYGDEHTLMPPSVRRVKYEKNYGVLRLDVACEYTDEVRTVVIAVNNVRDGLELAGYLRGLGAVVVERY